MTQIELQIDRVVGPTHHFGGLGVGNLASQTHAGQVSNPAAAALQGLDKMRLVARSGAHQLLLAPQRRPDFGLLRQVGFVGTDEEVLRRAAGEAPQILSAASSCSAMWTANAATVTPSMDSLHPVASAISLHLTVANLNASLHRAVEPAETFRELREVMPSDSRVNKPIPGGAAMRDEGAANHLRLSADDTAAGVHLFVYGDGDPLPQVNWPRQTLAACQAIARLHLLPPENTFFLKQHPDAIDAGAFHNDVVAMSHASLIIHHQLAFYHAEPLLDQIQERFFQLHGVPLRVLEVSQEVLSIDDAVGTYLFNSQILSSEGDVVDAPPESTVLPPTIICPKQVQDHDQAYRLVCSWCEQGLFKQVHFVDLSQSMSGGGGPACLRLRVPMCDSNLPSLGRWSNAMDERLREVINRHYVTRLTLEDLARIEFHREAEIGRQRIDGILRGGFDE